ncbi:MAG: SDR family oxidoreductase [Pseudonocardia sp.]|nr:SDR family oxidoreductase [Pseudonocardia sp.]
MDLQLKGKRAIVTGGSRGIGFAVADTLAAEGADVVIVSRNQGSLTEAAEKLRAHGGRVLPLVADTSDDASVRAMVDAAVAELGGVDVLVNSAASPASAGSAADLAGTTDDAVREQIEVKVLGYLRCARAVAPHMTAQGWGRIVHVSGLNARRSSQLVGAMRNVAVAAMGAALAQELGPHGVNVSVVHPGFTVTERTPGMIARSAGAQGISEAEAEARFAATTTVGRLITAQEVADVIAFLASPRSVSINGESIAAGGGTPDVIHY